MDRKINNHFQAFHNKKVFFENTPDVLLENIARLNSILHRYRNANGETQDVMMFYEGILRILRLAYFYIKDTEYIHEKNMLLENNVKFLAEYNRHIEKKLNEYETITRLKEGNRLKDVMDCADAYVERVFELKNTQNNSENKD